MASVTQVVATPTTIDGQRIASRNGDTVALELDGGQRVASRSGDVFALDLEGGQRIASRSVDASTAEPAIGQRPASRTVTATLPAFTYGITVPTGYQSVDVLVRDAETEEPITDVRYITSPGLLAIMSPVDEYGRARLWLRSADYTEFLAIAERKGSGDGPDYTWYSVADRQESINPITDDTATIWLERAELKGMIAGGNSAGFAGQF